MFLEDEAHMAITINNTYEFKKKKKNVAWDWSLETKRMRSDAWTRRACRGARRRERMLSVRPAIAVQWSMCSLRRGGEEKRRQAVPSSWVIFNQRHYHAVHLSVLHANHQRSRNKVLSSGRYSVSPPRFKYTDGKLALPWTTPTHAVKLQADQ